MAGTPQKRFQTKNAKLSKNYRVRLSRRDRLSSKLPQKSSHTTKTHSGQNRPTWSGGVSGLLSL